MKKNKVLGFLVFLLILVVLLIDFVDVCKGLSQIGSFSREKIYGSLMFLSIFNLIVDCVCLLASVVGVVILINDGSENTAFNLAILPVGLLGLLYAVTIITTQNMYNTYYQVLSSPETTTMIVFGFVTAVSMLICLFLHFIEYRMVKKILGVCTCLFYVVIFIPLYLLLNNNSSIASSSSFLSPISASILPLMILIGVFAAAFVLSMEESHNVYDAHATHNFITPSHSTSTLGTASKVDPAKELEKLKILLKNDIISQETYDEKAKKYIDML